MPLVVFTTAYDEYALKAFEVHALDYLLKPFDSPRFLRTLERARERLERQRAGDLGKRLLAMVQDLKPEAAQPPDRLVVKSGGRIFFVRTDEIDWVDAAGNYVRLHVKGESYLFRETMSAMEARLDPSRFVRIHRSHIVNADRIKELQPGNGDHAVVLRSGARLPLSRGYRDKLQEQDRESLIAAKSARRGFSPGSRLPRATELAGSAGLKPRLHNLLLFVAKRGDRVDPRWRAAARATARRAGRRRTGPPRR